MQNHCIEFNGRCFIWRIPLSPLSSRYKEYFHYIRGKTFKRLIYWLSYRKAADFSADMYNEIMVTFPLSNNFCLNGEDVFLSEAFPFWASPGCRGAFAWFGWHGDHWAFESWSRFHFGCSRTPFAGRSWVLSHKGWYVPSVSQQCSPMAKRTDELSPKPEKQPQPASASAPRWHAEVCGTSAAELGGFCSNMLSSAMPLALISWLKTWTLSAAWAHP